MASPATGANGNGDHCAVLLGMSDNGNDDRWLWMAIATTITGWGVAASMSAIWAMSEAVSSG